MLQQKIAPVLDTFQRHLRVLLDGANHFAAGVAHPDGQLGVAEHLCRAAECQIRLARHVDIGDHDRMTLRQRVVYALLEIGREF
jgi:hypothetical protein